MVLQFQDLCRAVSQAYNTHTNRPNFVVKNSFIRHGQCVWDVQHITGSSYHNGEPDFAVRHIREFWRSRTTPPRKMRDLFYTVQRRQSGDILTTLCLSIYKTFKERGYQFYLGDQYVEDVRPALIEHVPVEFNPLLEIGFEDDEPWMPEAIVHDYGLLVCVDNDQHVVDLSADFFDIHDHLPGDEHCPYALDDPSSSVSEVSLEEFGRTFFTKMQDEDCGILEEMYEAMSAASVQNLQTYIDDRKAAKKREKNKRRKQKKRRIN